MSIMHLEPATAPGSDPFGRNEPPVESVENKTGHEEREIERLVSKRTFGRLKKEHYLVRWKGFSQHYNQWIDLDQLGNARELIKDYEAEMA